MMQKSMKVALGASVVAVVAAASFSIATAPAQSRPIAVLLESVTGAEKPAVKFARNVSPDYTSFAFAYGGVVGAASYEVASSLTTARDLGDAICNQLSKGDTESELEMRLVASSTYRYPINGAGAITIVEAAKALICSGK